MPLPRRGSHRSPRTRSRRSPRGRTRSRRTRSRRTRSLRIRRSPRSRTRSRRSLRSRTRKSQSRSSRFRSSRPSTPTTCRGGRRRHGRRPRSGRPGARLRPGPSLSSPDHGAHSARSDSRARLTHPPGGLSYPRRRESPPASRVDGASTCGAPAGAGAALDTRTPFAGGSAGRARSVPSAASVRGLGTIGGTTTPAPPASAPAASMPAPSLERLKPTPAPATASAAGRLAAPAPAPAPAPSAAKLEHEWVRRDDGDGGAHRRPGAHQMLTRRSRGDPEGRGDLLVRAALELAQEQRVALGGRERMHGADDAAKPLAVLDLRFDARHDLLSLVVVERRNVALAAQDVERGVVDDPVEPGLQVDGAFVGHKGGVGAREPLLHDILRSVVSDEPARYSARARGGSGARAPRRPGGSRRAPRQRGARRSAAAGGARWRGAGVWRGGEAASGRWKGNPAAVRGPPQDDCPSLRALPRARRGPRG